MKHLVVLTGAGISVESDLGTFRDSNEIFHKENNHVRYFIVEVAQKL